MISFTKSVFMQGCQLIPRPIRKEASYERFMENFCEDHWQIKGTLSKFDNFILLLEETMKNITLT